MAAPRLLAVDEMSLGLAPVVVDQLLEVLIGIREQGVTVLLVEQDVFAAFSVADRGYVMETGRTSEKVALVISAGTRTCAGLTWATSRLDWTRWTPSNLPDLST